MLGRPLAVVGLNRIVLLPLFTGTVKVVVTQVVHAPVGSKAAAGWVTAPLTSTSAGRLMVAPLAYRMPGSPCRRRRGDGELGRRADRVVAVAETGAGEAGVVGLDETRAGGRCGLGLVAGRCREGRRCHDSHEADSRDGAGTAARRMRGRKVSGMRMGTP